MRLSSADNYGLFAEHSGRNELEIIPGATLLWAALGRSDADDAAFDEPPDSSAILQATCGSSRLQLPGVLSCRNEQGSTGK